MSGASARDDPSTAGVLIQYIGMFMACIEKLREDNRRLTERLEDLCKTG